MKYEELINTVSEIVNNDNIRKEGLTIVYELDEKQHKQMDEHLYYTMNPKGEDFEHKDLVEVNVGGITVKFVKKNKTTA